jgi:hypothetical protein
MGRNSGYRAGPILEEICARVEAMRTAAGTAGVKLRPPLLMLGTSERVGSNWQSDTLRPVASQHNEPFRQQLAPDHGLSALNPHPGRCTAEALGTLGPGRVTADFIRFARAFPIAPGVEPKLALAIGAYAATHPVVATETSCEVIDLGAPACRCERSQLPVAKASARQGVTISDGPFPHGSHEWRS